MARTRPAIRVHLSVADHDKTSAIWANLEQRGMLVELWRKAGEKWAGKREDKVPLRPTDRLDIACSADQSTADLLLSDLCFAMNYRIRYYPNRWVVTIHNFSIKQGYQPSELNVVPGSRLPKNSTPPIPSPIPSPIPRKREEPDSKPEASPPAPKGRKPEDFDAAQSAQIRKWATGKGYSSSTLHEAMEIFREWEPLKQQRRSSKQWLAAFKRICRESVDDGKIGKKQHQAATIGDHKPTEKQLAAREILAQAKRDRETQTETNDEDPESVAKVIDLSLRQA